MVGFEHGLKRQKIGPQVIYSVGVGVIVEIKKKIIPGRMPIFKKS